MTAVEIRDLVRLFRPARRSDVGRAVQALRGVTLDIDVGEVHGLLGPNGAGKTTVCRILATVLLPTSGTAKVLGHDVVAEAPTVKRRIGIVFGGDRGLYTRLTARQNLRFWGAMYGLRGRQLRRRIDALLDRYGLGERSDERVDTFSRGMKQRLHLARGMIAEPPVLILDEPTTGMDPVSAHTFRSLVSELRADGRTVLLTTHDMAEAAAVCDRISLIGHGEILVTDRPAGVGHLISEYERVDVAGCPDGLRRTVADLDGVMAVSTLDDGQLRIETRNSDATLAVVRLLAERGVSAITTGRPNLEEVYLHVFGERGMEIGR